eukprot:364270-Chlamydomonas_euryale.AAC.14
MAAAGLPQQAHWRTQRKRLLRPTAALLHPLGAGGAPGMVSALHSPGFYRFFTHSVQEVRPAWFPLSTALGCIASSATRCRRCARHVSSAFLFTSLVLNGCCGRTRWWSACHAAMMMACRSCCSAAAATHKRRCGRRHTQAQVWPRSTVLVGRLAWPRNDTTPHQATSRVGLPMVSYA